MKQTIENILKSVAMCLLPAPILYRLWHLRRRARPRTADSTAGGQRVIRIKDGAYLVVYWGDVRIGCGPCASMFVLREEVLRIDCLGGTMGHMHVNPVQLGLLVGWRKTPRQYFPPGTWAEQIDRAVFELTANTAVALETNQLSRIRRFVIEKDELDEAGRQMGAYMHELAASHAEQRVTAE